MLSAQQLGAIACAHSHDDQAEHLLLAADSVGPIDLGRRAAGRRLTGEAELTVAQRRLISVSNTTPSARPRRRRTRPRSIGMTRRGACREALRIRASLIALSTPMPKHMTRRRSAAGHARAPWRCARTSRSAPVVAAPLRRGAPLLRRRRPSDQRRRADRAGHADVGPDGQLRQSPGECRVPSRVLLIAVCAFRARLAPRATAAIAASCPISFWPLATPVPSTRRDSPERGACYIGLRTSLVPDASCGQHYACADRGSAGRLRIPSRSRSDSRTGAHHRASSASAA